MSLRTRLQRSIDAVLARRGLRLMADWRLHKWDQSCHTRDLFQFLNVDCVLDVGGNIGQYQEFLRLHVGYRGHIVSFEPIHELYEQLRRARAHDPKWSVHRLALGEEDTAQTLNVMRERTLSSFLARNEAQLQKSGYEKYLRETEVETTEDVPVRRLDRILQDVLPDGAERLFLKSDTQGYDMSVVAGASGCLDRILALQVELSVRHVYLGSPDYLDALRALQSMGYELTALFPVQRDSARRVVNLDCVMLRRDEAERLRAHAHRPGGN